MEDKDMRVMFIASTNLPENFDHGFLRRFRSCVQMRLSDRDTKLAMIRQLRAYELDDNVMGERLHNLATQLASWRTISGGDFTEALESDLRSLFMKSRTSKRSCKGK